MATSNSEILRVMTSAYEFCERHNSTHNRWEVALDFQFTSWLSKGVIGQRSKETQVRVAIFKLLRVCAISRAYSKVSVKSIDFIELKKTMGRISLYLCIEGTQTFLIRGEIISAPRFSLVRTRCSESKPWAHRGCCWRSEENLQLSENLAAPSIWLIFPWK